MTEKEVLNRVQQIADMADDDEAAHAHEDQLHQSVLGSIAEGSCVNPSACAAAALKTNKIQFERWCA